MVVLISLTASGMEWGLGVSSEPADISGGGFFLDVSWDVRLFTGVGRSGLTIRPCISIGPLPIRVRFVVLDTYVIWDLDLDGLSGYVGAGPGVVMTTGLNLYSHSVVAVVGLCGIMITDSIELYVQAKLRSEGFFLSPGLGILLEF
jgi:hypothetical protein